VRRPDHLDASAPIREIKTVFLRLRHYWPVVLMASIGVFSSIAAFQIKWNGRLAAIDTALQIESQHRHRMIAKGLSQYEILLDTVVAHIENAGGGYDGPEFSATFLKLLPGYPGVEALGYAPLVTGESRGNFETIARARGNPSFEILEQAADGGLVSAGRRSAYFPLANVVPAAGNQMLFGLDLEREWNETLIRARDSALPASSAPVRLTWMRSPTRQRVLIAAPVYVAGLSPLSVEQRRLGLAGYVVIFLRIDDAIDSILRPGTVKEGFDDYLYFGPVPNSESIVHVHRLEPRGSRLPASALAAERIRPEYTDSVRIADRIWTVVTVPTKAAYTGAPGPLEFEILIGGLLATALLCGYQFVAIRRAGKLHLAATELTQEVAHRIDAEDALRVTLQRAQLQLQTIGQIATADQILSGDVEELARQITELAVKAVGCERANVWLFDEAETTLRCIDLFEAAPARHSADMRLDESNYRDEFHALKIARYVDANDALTDPRTSGYVDSYLKPLGITSMLDTVIQLSGKNLGLLCLEHVGKPHRWSQDEISFASQLADKVGLALLSRKRREAEALLLASEGRFRALVEQAPEAILVYDLGRNRFTDANTNAEVMFGCPRDELLDSGPQRFYVGAAEQAQTGDGFAEQSRRALAGDTVVFDQSIRNSRGKTLICEIRLAPLPSTDAQLVRASFIDVTERRGAEDRMRFANTLLASEIESAPDGVLVVESGTARVSYNTRFAEMWTLPPDGGIGIRADDILEIIAKRLVRPDKFRAEVIRFRADPSIPIELEIETENGRILECHGGAMRGAPGQYLGRINFFRDITARKQAERALQRSEAELGEAQRIARLGSWSWDSRTQAVHWSEELCRMVGRDPHQPAPSIEQQASIFTAQSYEALLVALRRCVYSGQSYTLDLEFVRTDGVKGWMQGKGEAERDETGAIVRARGTALDITERKQAEERVRTAQAALAEAQAVAHIGSWQLDLRSDVLAWSDETYRLFGVDPSSFWLSYESFLALVHADDRAVLSAARQESIANRALYTVDYRVAFPDGNIRVLQERGQVFYGDDNKPLRSVGTVQDITERKAAQEALHNSREQYRSLIETTPDWVWEMDDQLRFTYSSPQSWQLLGYRSDEVVGRSAFDFMAKADAERVASETHDLFANRRPLQGHVTPFMHKAGHQVLTETNAVPFYDGSGRYRGYRGVDRDVTERTKASQALTHERDFSAALIGSLPGLFVLLDASGHLVRWNDNLPRVVGRSDEELRGLDAFELILERDRDMARSRMGDLLAQGRADVEMDMMTKGGGSRTFHFTGQKIASGGRDYLVSVGTDVTEAREAETRLRASEERFRTIFGSVNDGLFVHDADTHAFLDVNQRVCEMFEYSREEILARDFGALSAGTAPYRGEDAALLLKRAAAGEAVIFEWLCKSKSAREFWIEVALRRTRFGEREVVLATARDITERRMAIDALTYRDRILHAVTVSTAEMVVADSPEHGMSTALKMVGEALSVDRVLVLEYDLDRGRPPALRASWQVDDVPLRVSQDDLVRSAPDPSALLAWRAPLADGRPVITQVDTAEGPVHQLMEHLRIKSMLMMPIFVEGRLWGAIGIEMCSASREWSATETDALRTFSEVIGVVVMRNLARRFLEQSEQRFRAVSETAQDAIILVNSTGNTLYWNRAAERILGYTPQEVIGKDVHALLTPPRFHDKASAGMKVFAATGDGGVVGQTRELAAIRKDGVEIPIELSISSMRLGSEWHAVAMLRDITDRKQAEAQITRMATHDALTGLANRAVFVEQLQVAIARAHRGGLGLAVLYLDLDHFKDVNDTLGHPMGDILLQMVAKRLKESVRETDTVARFGGDEFAVIATDIREPADVAVLADKILKTIGEPFPINGNDVRTGTSVGIAVYDADSPDTELLLSHADVALYRAKSEGRGTYRYFTDSMDVEVRARVTMGAELREAIGSGQLFLVYQPQVNVDTGGIVGVEALVRWRHPIRGVVSPGEFIPAAEKSGLIVTLGRWVMREACRQTKAWADAGIAPPLTAVNLSALQFKTPGELEKDVAAILADTGLSSRFLELELTESVLMEAALEHNDVLLRLRDSGLRIAIDDFGTGYSSLNYLRRFPVDRIKIAQDFVRHLTPASGDAAIVKAAISLAHELNLKVVVEGVETAEQLNLIRSWGCHEVQGYYYSKPLSADQVAVHLRAGKIAAPLAKALEMAKV
jgi:diguanylate cyclase (GGDEF)-like protein/PAS domain S-box-containing protein